MNRKSLVIMLKNTAVMFAVYLIQFVLMPLLFPNYYPRSNESVVILLATLLTGFILGVFLGSRKIKFWILPDILYGLMIMVYSGSGLYGIGLRGISLDGAQPYYDSLFAVISVGILLVALVVVQLVMILSVNIAVKIFRKNRKKESGYLEQ